jgi:hypothetical protein
MYQNLNYQSETGTLSWRIKAIRQQDSAMGAGVWVGGGSTCLLDFWKKSKLKIQNY